MPTLSFSVDGVPLSSMASDIEASSSRRSLGGARVSDAVLPGTNGVVPGPMTHDVRDFSLSMWVIGADSSGNVPTDGTQLALYEANLDNLLALFGQRHKLLELSMVVGDGTTRRTRARVTNAFAPNERLDGAVPLAKFTVIFDLVDVFWSDAGTVTDTHPFTTNVSWWANNFYGTTAPIEDAVVTITGPISNPGITCLATGAYVQYNGSLTVSDTLVIDCSTWSIKKNGVSVAGSSTSTSPDGRLLTLYPERNSSNGKWGIRYTTRGSGMGTGTSITVTARRKYL